MEKVRDYDDWFDDQTPMFFGSAHSVSSDGVGPDVIDRLHDVVEEVTGSRPVRHKARFGFV